MPLIQLVIVLVIIGFLLWLVQSVIPMDARIKQIVTAVVIVAVVLWLLGLFFGFGLTSGPYIGRPYR